MLTSDTVSDLIAQAITYDLEMPDSFRLASLGAVTDCYNGIGPDWMPEHLRDQVTKHFGYFAAAAMIHDWEYEHEEDRSREAFTAANERLRRNSRKLLQKGYPWYKRWLYRERPNFLADMCQEFGWGAWQDGKHPQ